MVTKRHDKVKRFYLLKFKFLFLFFVFLSAPLLSQFIPPHPRITKELLNAIKLTEMDQLLGISESNLIIRANRHGYLVGNGSDMASKRNVEAILMIQGQEYLSAIELFKIIKKKAPRFFPTRFNLGYLYLDRRNHYHALIEFNKARDLVPQFWLNYYYLGKAYELKGDYNSAIHHFRLAYRHNPYDFNSLVALGDLLLKRKRATEAKITYQYCLDQDDGYNDALVGMGKVAFFHRKYFKAIKWFKAVNTKLPYKKELHYYYGEAAFFAQLYETSAKQYKTLEETPLDEIFNYISLNRVRKRLAQAEKLARQLNETE